MLNSKIFSIFNYKKYIYLVLISNFFSIILLNDTTSFNLGLISLQSLIYSLNSFLFISFIIFETISSFLDFYGLTLNFLNLIISNLNNLNTEFNLYIFFINLKYFLFLFFNFLFLFFYDQILRIFKKLITKKNSFIFFTFFSILIIFILQNNYLNNFYSLNDRITKKLIFISKGNVLRNDNWFIVLRNTLNYSKNHGEYLNFSFEKEFKNFGNLENIYIVINESYPNFKDRELKNKLYSALTSDLNNVEIHKLKKDWSKNYSTQGSELELFCDQKGSWKDFNKNLDDFLIKNNCWINSLYDRHNIYIHSYEEDSFSRSRYFNEQPSFFKESFFKQDLLELDYTTCNKNLHYIHICEDQIVNKLLFDLKKINKKKLIIYLTVENHIPVKIKNEFDNFCNNSILKLHPQFCTLFNNQIIFNKDLNKFIKKLDYGDLLVFFSDTPPLYSIRDRIHFEDYIDVFFFKKK